MNRFFRSAFFPLIVIAALAWLAIKVLDNSGKKQVPTTTWQVINWIQTSPENISPPVVIDPNHQSLTLTYNSKQYIVNYATPQSEAAVEALMLKNKVDFTSNGVGGFSWTGALFSFLPFVLLM